MTFACPDCRSSVEADADDPHQHVQCSHCQAWYCVIDRGFMYTIKPITAESAERTRKALEQERTDRRRMEVAHLN